jgi:hypothetical protein
MKALWGLLLGVLVCCLIWSASVVRSTGRPVHRTRIQAWPTFAEDVTEAELQDLYSGFLARKLVALRPVLRGGQLQFEVTDPETSEEHTLHLEQLGDQYSAERSFTPWQSVVLRTMFRGHDIHEWRMKKDAPKFPDIPKDPYERRAFVLEWQAPTREQEWERWVEEWRSERPLFQREIVPLGERKQRILLYLFDRFYLGQDELAQLARELHYLQPALSIWKRTESWYARLMHFKRALAILRDRVVVQQLTQECPMEK